MQGPKGQILTLRDRVMIGILAGAFIGAAGVLAQHYATRYVHGRKRKALK